MIEPLLLLLFINSIYIFGLHAASDFEYLSEDNPELGVRKNSKMVLWWVRYYSEMLLGDFWAKPIAKCITCMSSVHSIYFFWPFMIAYYGFQPHHVFYWIIYVGTLAGVNYILGEVIHLIKSVSYYFQSH